MEKWSYAETSYDFLNGMAQLGCEYAEDYDDPNNVFSYIELILMTNGGGSCFVEFFDEQDHVVGCETVEV